MPSSELASLVKNKESIQRYKHVPIVIVNPNENLAEFDIRQISVSYLSS